MAASYRISSNGAEKYHTARREEDRWLVSLVHFNFSKRHICNNVEHSRAENEARTWPADPGEYVWKLILFVIYD